ncbi:hypothetical protein V1477_017388 [Vespula maculifrons]|uniref:Uncharacterized protein n=1 Tax=Vespula maculifrons TaxID=7453 RepID=A0ABD2B5W5_VESMC
MDERSRPLRGLPTSSSEIPNSTLTRSVNAPTLGDGDGDGSVGVGVGVSVGVGLGVGVGVGLGVGLGVGRDKGAVDVSVGQPSCTYKQQRTHRHRCRLPQPLPLPLPLTTIKVSNSATNGEKIVIHKKMLIEPCLRRNEMFVIDVAQVSPMCTYVRLNELGETRVLDHRKFFHDEFDTRVQVYYSFVETF